ncbi:SERTA domain-containing protein 2-like [Spea bombifrons]|uniref:SERTA domain-containing protein 2-like n=1 Tax=Spea bombifrons TaxID=233779 RepID=UPI0023499BC0|nr:SERTA domain-containing protein 2-like [Spea bombifrons]
MLGRGLKRKFNDCETMTDFSSACDCNRNNMPYSHQRQLVLNMCLNKLQSYKMLVEPNLHRSVLIANTVRQIQEETRQEANQLPGTICNDVASNDVIYAGNEPLENTVNLPCGTNTDFFRDAWGLESPAESLMEITDDDVSSAISSILKDLDFMEDTSPSQSPGAVTDDHPNPLENPNKAGDKQDLKGAECAFGSFEITSSTSYLKDLSVDDIFDDIDTSMYDSDFSFSSFFARTQPASEETVKLLASCNSQSANNLQACRTDFIFFF